MHPTIVKTPPLLHQFIYQSSTHPPLSPSLPLSLLPVNNMMLGEPPPPPDTAVHVTPWPILEDPDFDPSVDLWDTDRRQHLQDIMAALQRYFPRGQPEAEGDQDVSDECSCDEFRMYEFKIRRCARGSSHDWTECPYAHPGEKARRRDPRRYLYSGTACPDFRKGCCRKGDSCEFAHGVFECWLHPSRYRTQPCKDGMGCRRRVCFFAHLPEQLRVVSHQSPRSAVTEATCMKALPFSKSPGTLSPEESPPMSPSSDVAVLFRNLQLNKVKSLPVSCLSGFGSGSAYGSPRGPLVQTGFFSLPTTPTGAPTRKKVGWEIESCHDEPVMERVESGRSLRARMLEKLSRENSVGAAAFEADEPDPLGCSLDVGWVSDLLK